MKTSGGRLVLVAAAILVALSAPLPAAMIWEWSFDGEAGQFITDGTGSAPGTYTLIDFSVVTSASGATPGSLSGGEYFTPVYSTDRPMMFVWDGSKVVQWIHSGSNLFDWWAFGSNVDGSTAYFFAWDFGNFNVPERASRFDGVLGEPLALGDVRVTPTGVNEVPEPATYLLIGGGLALLAAWRRRA